MDPISLILAALAAGASAALKDTAGDAIKDAYAGLKALIKRRLTGDGAAEAKLEEIEQQPDADPSALRPHLEAAAADRDEELVRLARALMERVDPQGAKAGKYQVAISGGNVGAVGDNASVSMTFKD
jgi:hypothetical protein